MGIITNKPRNKYETKIELLLDIITNKNENKQDPYFTFTEFLREQQHSPLLTIWDKIEQFYSTICDWYSDNEFYHKIGYLVSARAVGNYKGINLADLVTKALDKDSTKDSFKSYIDNLIQKSIDWNFKELRYDEDPDKIFNILLLFLMSKQIICLNMNLTLLSSTNLKIGVLNIFMQEILKSLIKPKKNNGLNG